MSRDYARVQWDSDVAEDCRQLVRLAIREDLAREYDWTTVSLIDDQTGGKAVIRARGPGVVAGLPAVELAIREMNAGLDWETFAREGSEVRRGEEIARLAGPARAILTAERLILNVLGRLSGVATLTRQFVERIRGTPARVYDTRKTTPGWRLLEKYAVAQGGGHNHRRGLYDGILIKDNHLAVLSLAASGAPARLGDVVRTAREFIAEHLGERHPDGMPVEIEVDSLDQLRQAMEGGPDIVLLDNMTLDQLREAVRIRNALAPSVELEASGGVTLDTVRDIAQTGVERISAGALTHHAVWLDFGLDWGEPAVQEYDTQGI